MREFRAYFAKIVIKHNMNFLIRRTDCVEHKICLNNSYSGKDDGIVELALHSDMRILGVSHNKAPYITLDTAKELGFFASMADLFYSLTVYSPGRYNEIIVLDDKVYIHLGILLERYRKKREEEDEKKKKKRTAKKSS